MAETIIYLSIPTGSNCRRTARLSGPAEWPEFRNRQRRRVTNSDTNTSFTFMRPQFSAVQQMFCRPKAVLVSRTVAERLSLDRGHYGSFVVFAVCLRCLAVLCSCRTAENRGFDRISVKGYKHHLYLDATQLFKLMNYLLNATPGRPAIGTWRSGTQRGVRRLWRWLWRWLKAERNLCEAWRNAVGRTNGLMDERRGRSGKSGGLKASIFGEADSTPRCARFGGA